jgi:cytochrome c oxidase subunit 3
LPDTSPPLAHQFDDLGQQKETSLLGMWTFLITEVLFFGGMFAGYAEYRYRYPQAFMAGSRQLDLMLGTINTAVLITSSLTMALGVRSAQLGKRKHIVSYLAVTVLLGLGFLGIKSVEYAQKFTEHLIPGHDFALAGPSQTQLFFSFYFAMTGMHALHMIVGVVVVSLIAFFAWRGRYSPAYHNPVEVAGLYWHFVDIIWIFLFPLLYLIGRH